MITVLLTVFNGQDWLIECIESILNQSYKNFEFLIIDDGSEDNSLSIIKYYSKIDKRIKYISQENIGLTKSLNKGLRIAKGDWIARIDSDDISYSRRLELQLNYVLQKDINLVGCQSIIIDSKGLKKGGVIIPTDHKRIYSNLENQKRFFSHSSVLFNKKLILKLGGYREIMKKSQDYDLWLRVCEVSEVGCLPYIGNCLRMHNKNISYGDKGIEQRIYAHCANISHILRLNYGYQYDPIKKNNFKKSKVFFEFVKINLERSGTLNFYEKLYEYKKKTDKFRLVFRTFFIPFYFNNFSLILKLIFWIYKGDFISKSISKEWLKSNK